MGNDDYQLTILNRLAEKICINLNANSCSIWLASDNELRIKQLGFFVNANHRDEFDHDLDYQVAELAFRNEKRCFEYKMIKNSKYGVAGIPLRLFNKTVGAVCVFNNSCYIDKENYLQLVVNEATFNTLDGQSFACITRGPIAFSSKIISSNSISGDYLDIFKIQDGKLGICIGDVMGKGIETLPWVVMTKLILGQMDKENIEPNLLINEINNLLYNELNLAQIFITLQCAVVDTISNQLLISSAGHHPPILYHRKTKNFEVVKVKGPFLGGIQNLNYSQCTMPLQYGDILIFYTDGLTEAFNVHKEQFGLERLLHSITESHFLSPGKIIDKIINNLQLFIEKNVPQDDIALAVLKIGNED